MSENTHIGQKLAQTSTQSNAPMQLDLVEFIEQRERQVKAKARAPNTLLAYRKAIDSFEAWCKANGAPYTVPVDVLAVKGYLLHMKDAGKAYGTVSAHLSAIAAAHRMKELPFDRTPFVEMLKGMRSEYVEENRGVRQVRAVTGDELGMIVGLQPDTPRGARNRLLLALGFAGAMRRSEIVTLDWLRRGEGMGYVEPVSNGYQIVLDQAKTSNGKPQTITIPRTGMPTACAGIEQWVALARIEAGQPLLREVNKGGEIGQRRLSDHSVARIIKTEVYRLERLRGATEEQARERSRQVSGHSLRAGYCTTAAMKKVPVWEIRNRSRHKTLEMVSRYVREADAWTDSGLDGVGF